MGEASAGADGVAVAAEAGAAGDERGAVAPVWGRARLLVPLYLLATAVVTWPLAWHLPSRLAYGAEPTETVPLFNLWTLRWNQARIADLYRGYWDAPIFFPAEGTFALSEPQPLTGLAFAPVAWATGNPVLAFNVVALAFLVLNGWAAARLARHLGVAAPPAAALGALAVALPFVMGQAGVLQLTAVFPLVALVDALLRWGTTGGGRRLAAEAGAWWAATFLTCGYYGLFAGVAVVPVVLVLARRDWLRRGRARDVGVAALALAPAVPALVAQARLTDGYTRTEDLIRALSARPGDLRLLSPGSGGLGVVPWVGEAAVDGFALYPGTALLGLAVAGFVLARRSDAPGRRRAAWFLLAGAVLARLLSFGLRLGVGGVEPYEAVRALVPGFASLRSPFRFAAVSEVFLLGLAGLGLDALWRWRPAVGRGRAVGRWATVAVVALGVAEVALVPMRTFAVDRRPADWVAFVEERDEPDEVLAFLPGPANGRAASYVPTVRNMLGVLDAGVTTVNGYSGLWPPAYDRLEAELVNYPAVGADALIREMGVTVVIVDRPWLEDRPDVADWLGDRYVAEFTGPDHVAYTVPPTSGRIVG
jgi:hypothetical protein